ncbi:MAG: serine acetyltransferase [Terrimicrobiaceae bacterium]
MKLLQDLKANKSNPKGAILLLAFRVAHALRFGPWWLLPIAALYGITYRVLVEWVLGVELPWKTKVGSGLRLEHGQGLVVNDGTVIGAGCTLRNGVTIGIKQLEGGGFSAAPVLGNRVDVGANALIIGPIHVGDDVVIGAGAVVVKDVPNRAVVAGNPSRILRIKPESGNPTSAEVQPSDAPDHQV